MGIASPEFASLDPPSTVDLLSLGFEREQIRARVRLTHPDTEVAFTLDDLRQDLLAYFRIAIAKQHRSALAIGYPMRPHRRARREQFFGGGITLEKAAFGAAVFGWPGQSRSALARRTFD